MLLANAVQQQVVYYNFTGKMQPPSKSIVCLSQDVTRAYLPMLSNGKEILLTELIRSTLACQLHC